MMNTFTSDLVCRALSGKSSKEAGWNMMFKELIQTNTAMFASFNLENFFPRLAKLLDLLIARLFHVPNKGEEVNRRWDNVLEMIIQNHEKGNRDDGLLSHEQAEGEESDFIDALLSVQHEYDAVVTRNHMKATLMDMIGAGTDTSFFVLDTSMAELMRRPELMAKLC
ncbi:hypothetical protein QYE76_027816 [Lolium multiflorum]|uniref:Uncharacterized protein n=1 Tax=Lolium multiflorum TaxID=4521 RepID=A0AAD8VGG4_LOLMU|nr:hypothetical protein QYE76_027816 [Lolium multiflorum]